MLAITSYPLDIYEADAAKAGAQGIIAKNDFKMLTQAIATVHDGGILPANVPFETADFHIAFYLRRWVSISLLGLMLIADFAEMKLMQDPIDSFIGFASNDIFVFCIGILLAAMELTVQARQMEHNLRIASHLHSAVASELSSSRFACRATTISSSERTTATSRHITPSMS